MDRFINLPAFNMKIFAFFIEISVMPVEYINSFLFYFTLTVLRLIEKLSDVQCNFIFNLLVQLIDFAYVSCNVSRLLGRNVNLIGKYSQLVSIYV